MKRNQYFGLLIIAGISMQGCDRSSANDFTKWLKACPIIIQSNAENPILARAGDIVVRESDYLSLIHRMPANLSSVPLAPQRRRQYLDDVIRQKIMIKLATEAGVQQDPAYQQRLSVIENALLVSAFSEQIQVSEKEMHDYYQKHGKEFSGQEVMVSHISVKTFAQAKKAQTLLRKGHFIPGLKKDSVAQPQAGMPDHLFEKMIFTLKPGETSEPFKTDGAYEVVRREIQPSTIPSFEVLKPQLLVRLRAEKLGALFIQAQDNLKKPEVDEKLLNSLDLSSASPAKS